MNIYPRMQFKRDSFQSLDGKWKLNKKSVLVPSYVNEEEMVYEKSFEFVKESDRSILHFEGVDQIATVYLNNIKLGTHEGGYLPFEFEITDYVKEGSNNLKVEVKDKLEHTYPYGKQKKDRGGMWYTPISGIWKSVWIEQVPKEYIKDLMINPDLQGVDLKYIVDNQGTVKEVSKRIDIKNPILWTPDNPHLYYEKIKYKKDEVNIYFGLRTIEIKNINGVNRVCLNGTPIFLHGLLDQGYFKETNLIPKNYGEYEKEIKRLKALGFNTLRKHIKIEPDYFYYLCDKLGILLIQDMVNSGEYNFLRDTALGTLGIKLNDKTGLNGKRKEFFIEHVKDTIHLLYSHPSIVAYTIFNEGWGQFESDYMYSYVKLQDNSRLVDSTSGWFEQKKSDFDSKHIYFRLKKLKPKTRPLLVSECGGYSLNLEKTKKTYGYGACKNIEDLTDHIEKLYDEMIIPGIKKGVCGCIYTQVSDVEDEINGIYTFDRKICKVNEKRMKEISRRIYGELNEAK